MSSSSSFLPLLRELLDNRPRQNQQDYENMMKIIREYQNTMTVYQNNMSTYLLLLTELQLIRSRTEVTRRNTTASSTNPIYTNPWPPTQSTTRVSDSMPFSTANDTRRLFHTFMRENRGGMDVSGGIAEPSRNTTPVVNLIDVVLDYDEQSLPNLDESATVQQLFENDDFRNSILRAAGIETARSGVGANMRWVIEPSQSDEPPRGLTYEEIRRNTQSLIYHEGTMEGLLSTTCPITMEEYMEGDRLLQLRVCRHTFRERELVEWFQRERTCPVCRTLYG